MPCLIDTNVLIEALAGDATGDALERIKAALVGGASFSVITRMELLGWRGHTEQSRRATQALLDQLTEVGITPAVVSTVIGIRSNVAIKLPDAIIAASAITENLPLMTRNTKDFSRVPGLQVVDPFVG